MEVRNERTALIKTQDWSPDCVAAGPAALFRMMGISTRSPQSSKMPPFSQSLHRISSLLPVPCQLLYSLAF